MPLFLRDPHLTTLWRLALVAALAIAAGCATSPSPRDAGYAGDEHARQLYHDGELGRAADAWLAMAERGPAAQRAHYRLRAAEARRDNADLDGAAAALQDINFRHLQPEDAARADLLNAEIALARNDAAYAADLIHAIEMDLPAQLQPRALELLARAQWAQGDGLASADTRARLDLLLSGIDQQQNREQLMETLLAQDAGDLAGYAASLPVDDALLPWLDEALRGQGMQLPQTMPQPGHRLDEWSRGDAGYRPPRSIALLLPLSQRLSAVAQPIRDGFLAAHFASRDELRPTIHIYDSGTSADTAIAAYRRAEADGMEHIVGPLQRDAVSALLAMPQTLPILALNQSRDAGLMPAGVAEFALAPETEGAQAAAHMLARGVRRASVLIGDADWARRAAQAFETQFQAGGGSLAGFAQLPVDQVNYQPTINAATADLGDIDAAVFISMLPPQARLLLPQLRIAGIAGTVYATSHVYSGSIDPGLDRDLNDVEFCDAPWLLGTLAGRPAQDDISRLLPAVSGVGARLFAFGMDAYALVAWQDWLLQHPDSYLDGASGQLVADRRGQIHRLLAWGRFDNGMVRPVHGALSVMDGQQ